MKLFSKILTLLFLPISAFSAEIMGSWHTHFAYPEVSEITEGKAEIFVRGGDVLWALDKEFGSLRTISKIDGLSGSKISKIAYHKEFGALFIYYENADIDLLFDEGRVENIPDIQKKILPTSKAINQIYFDGKMAFLSCDFGVVQVDLGKREIVGSYSIGTVGKTEKVVSFARLGEQFFAATSDSIFIAEKNSILVNQNNWQKIFGGKIKIMHEFGGKIWLLQQNGKLQFFDGKVWENDTIFGEISDIKKHDNYLIVICKDNKIFRLQGEIKAELTGFQPLDATFKNGVYHIAEKSRVIRFSEKDKTQSVFQPNGPATNFDYYMTFSQGRLFVVTGARWENSNRPANIMKYENRLWSAYPMEELAVAPGDTTIVKKLSPQGFTHISFDPKDASHYYVTSWRTGIYEFRNNKFFKFYNHENSVLETALPGDKPKAGYYYYTAVNLAVFDHAGRLWSVSRLAKSTIKYIDTDGVMKNFYVPEVENMNTAEAFIIDKNNPNLKFIFFSRNYNSIPAIFAFDDGGTLENPADDKYKFITNFPSADGDILSPEFLLCAVQDDDGTIWVGTSAGIMLIKNPAQFFSPDFRFQQIKINRDDDSGLADYLLDNERINAIAIDGAGRKWIATETSGVYLLSPDGKETVQHFTAENSPLMSNTVISLAINPETGEVFFGTAEGLISFQSDAAEPKPDLAAVHAYPNPVRPEYAGVITVAGLQKNTNVKITDAAGNLIFQTTSKGSLAVWDGVGAGGKRVPSGVYHVICTTENNKIYAKTKILILR